MALSAVAGSNITIPAGTNPPMVGIIPGTKVLTATCAAGIIFAISCESSELANLSPAQSKASDGKSAQCTWSNSALTDKVGIYFPKWCVLTCRRIFEKSQFSQDPSGYLQAKAS